MGDRCFICPVARNKKTGEEGPSKFFMDLLGYSSNNRQFAKENYVLGTSEQFREEFGDQIKYDKNDEPTLTTFIKFIEDSVKEDKLYKLYNKRLGSGTFNYEEADNRRRAFEATEEESTNEEYTTVMTPQDGHKCKIEIGKNNTANRVTTRETIKNKALFDKIKAAVQALGGDITFIDERYSRYSTENAEQLANGLYAVIQLAEGKDLTVELAHEAGHFAVGALGDNNILVQRLLNALNDNVIKDLLGDEYAAIMSAKNPTREAAGALVGRYIAKEADAKSTFGKLVDRIVNSAKKMFYGLSGNSVELLKIEAKEAAEQIAGNFLSQKDAGSIENALETKETLFHKDDENLPKETEIFKQILEGISYMAKEIGAFDKIYGDKINKAVGKIAEYRLLSSKDLASELSAAGILDVLEYLEDQLPTIQNALDNVSIDMRSLTQSAANLRAASIFEKQLKAALDLINEFKNNASGVDNYKNEISKAMISLEKSRSALNFNLKIKEKRLFLSFLETAYGKEPIQRAARMVFKKGRVIYKEAKQIKISELLDKTDSSGDWLEYITSMSNSSDLLNQIVYKAAQAYNDQASQSVLETLEDLRELKNYCVKYGVNTEALFERYSEDIYGEDENGNQVLKHRRGDITGNYLTELNWGDWEESFKEFKRKLKREFDNLDPDNAKLFKPLYDFKLAEYSTQKIKDWHKENSFYNSKTKRYEPLGTQNPNHPNSGKYLSIEYNYLNGRQKDVVNQFLKIKKGHDDLLTQRTISQKESFAVYVSPVRMPQFRGRLNDETTNIAREGKKSLPKAYAMALWRRLIGAFTHQANDEDYGNENTNDVESNFSYSDEFESDLGDIRRVATYGINKLSDTTQLTHDLFSGMLQYSAMANAYNVQYQMCQALEVGGQALLQRKVNSNITEKERIASVKSTTKIYNRYQDFLKSQIYNLYNNSGNDIYIKGTKIAVDKAIGILNSAASQLYLAGNIGGAATNLGTGKIEIFKEAVGGSIFTVKDMLWADAIFTRYLPSLLLNPFNWGKENRTDKLSLFLQMFDSGNRLDEKVREYNSEADSNRNAGTTITSRLWRLNPFGHNKMVLYSSGDFYMQGVSYLAAARHIKIKWKDGSYHNLWDSLEVTHKDSNNKDSVLVLKFKKEVLEIGTFGNIVERQFGGAVFKGTELNSLPMEVNGIPGFTIADENDVIFETDAAGHTTAYTAGHKEVHAVRTNDGTIFIFDKGNHIQKLKDGKEIIFETDSKGRSAFKDMCREVNNKMHGIYNRMDKTYFNSLLYGKLLSSMKGYVFGSIVRKFMSDRYSVARGADVEGELITFAKTFMGMFAGEYIDTDPLRIIHNGSNKISSFPYGFKIFVLSSIFPFGKRVKGIITKAGYSEEQYRNMRKNWATGALLLVMGMIISAVASAVGVGDDDDEEKKKEKRKRRDGLIKVGYTKSEASIMAGLIDEAEIESLKEKYKEVGYTSKEISTLLKKRKSLKATKREEHRISGIFGYYLLGRLFAEQAAYFTPEGLDLERRSVLDFTPLSANLFIEIFNFSKHVITQDEVKKGSYKGWKKWEKDLVSKTPYLKSWTLFNDPYEAYQNWEYGRRVGK